MTRNEFLTELKDLLQTDAEIGEETELTALEEWDSITFMVLIAFFDKNFGEKITFEDLGACKTPKDLLALAGGAVF